MAIIPIGNYEACFALGEYLYGVEVSIPQLTIFDVTVKDAPSTAGVLVLAHVPTAIYVYESVAYIADVDGGVTAVDIDDPASPSVLGRVEEAGQNWSHIDVVGSTIVVSGPDSTGIGFFETTGGEPNPLLSYINDGGGTSQAVIQGRRILFADASGPNLYNYQVGGFRCDFIRTGALDADRINAEKILARHGYYSGSLVARELILVGVGGELGVEFRITIGERQIYWGFGTPEGNVAANIGSLFLSDGTQPNVFWVKEADDGLATGWVGK